MKYNQIYKNNNVWGNQPNELLHKIYYQLKLGMNFLDLGCGQGRDSLFMLQKGFNVDAIDNSQEGINKIKEVIHINNLSRVNINLFCSDIVNFNILKNKYDIINAFNSLQVLPKEKSLKIIAYIKNNIKRKGYIIISGFTMNDPFYKKTNNDKRCFFMPKELKNLFSDFEIIEYKEKNIKDNGHPGSTEPHQHGIVQLVAQKIKNSSK
ncbi:methyltransferase domain-containing protein [Patescibacteria group bacterium]|nr:methyltransferase domain-containing protein [Patescibacteria group bacterium]